MTTSTKRRDVVHDTIKPVKYYT